MVLDANTGAVLYATAADEPRYPASLTKMMTLYLAFEQVEQGRLSYASRIKISQEAASAAPSKLDMDPGEEITLGDAIRALITKSANDIAVAVAEHIAGSESKFAQLMTERAHQIGMRNTTFRNASGLPDPGQVTTARDMITLGLRLHDDFPKHYALFSTRSFSFNGSSFRNHNNLLFHYQGTEGIKTGYTRASGFNVVVSVKREGRHVMAAVFGGTTASARDVHMRALLNRTLPKAATQRTRKVEPMLVARAKPVPMPRPAPRPKPVAVAQVAPAMVQAAPKPSPRAVEPAKEPAVAFAKSAPAVVEPAPAETQREAVAAPAETSPEAPAPMPIAVAHVRRVMVPQRSHQARAAHSTDEENPQPAAAIGLRGTGNEHPERSAVTAAPGGLEPSRSRRGDLFAAAGGDGERAPMAQSPLESTETAIVKAPGRQPSSLAAQAQALAGAPAAASHVPLSAQSAHAAVAASVNPPHSARSIQAAAAVPQPAASPSTPVVPGKRPSTLQDQARAMERGGAAALTPAPSVRLAARNEPAAAAVPAYRLKGPEQGSAAAIATAQAGGGFHIQVGAYATQAEAERQIALARQRGGAALAAAAPAMIPVQKGNRQLLRARFTGLDANNAASACMELRRQQIDCFVMRAE